MSRVNFWIFSPLKTLGVALSPVSNGSFSYSRMPESTILQNRFSALLMGETSLSQSLMRSYLLFCLTCAFQARTRSPAIPSGLVYRQHWPCFLTSLTVTTYKAGEGGTVIASTATLDSDTIRRRLFSARFQLHFCKPTARPCLPK